MFENHVNDFFEYAVKQTQTSENDPFYEKCNKDRFPTLFVIAQDFFSIPATLVVQVVLLMIVALC
ncbi:30220_t:CDS:2 [Gigaspora margarita]|uniref:30220_t:CDS:1 n=1 Tax=Gigaspora margarita TaxID=4874 RepID=A0ABN7U835_GIGMA|nr:30220_t:CDS:2 [Gigaspora margarita]